MADTARMLEGEDVLAIAQALCSAQVTAVEHAASGGNSRIYRVTTPEKTYALKYYPPVVAGQRDRLCAEIAALEFFAKNGIASTPQVYGSRDRFALYSWMDGALPAQLTPADINAACDFLAELPRLSQTPEAQQFTGAAEACTSLHELLSQITRRVDRLQQIAANEPTLKTFLDTKFHPEWRARMQQARALWSAENRDEAEELSTAQRCLIPADFGFHNILKRPDGTLGFIDFEYFGWDDPVKLIADTLLHPGHTLDAAALARLKTRAGAIFVADARFIPRLHALLPLFSLRWALILCNEFLPEKHANRAFASNAETDWEQAKQRQLRKAEAMLDHPALALR